MNWRQFALRGLVLLSGAGAGGGALLAAVITEHDSTQPRGAPPGGSNGQGKSTDPIADGFRAPARFAATPTSDKAFKQSMGSMMSYSVRDPSFLATLNVANKDMINYINSLPGDPANPTSVLGRFLKDNKLDGDNIRRDSGGRLTQEHLLPISADFCLRCHAPVGWLEAHSEPKSSAYAFLKGDFWARSIKDGLLDAGGNPRAADLAHESEAEMEGVQCDSCHRTTGTHARPSRYDGSKLPAGSGGFFVTQANPFGADGLPYPINDVQESSRICGSCHDIDNPLVKTKTVVNGAVPDMPHPIERTYTEWYWSAYRTQPASQKECKSCHQPMQFQGAQTWMLYPAMDKLWGDVDRKWADLGLDVSPTRTAALKAGAAANKQFMATQAARVQLIKPASAVPGRMMRFKVKVTNLTGHKLPTGFIEGRQMWLHVKAVDAAGNVLFEDGVLDAGGALVRTVETKVYEQKAEADGYPSSVVAGNDKEFHFALINKIVKDNRIPPLGFNKAAYQADGAFIVPHDPKDTDYADGQNWDVTPYAFMVPASAAGPIRVTATLKYQTFNKEYIDFLRSHDDEKTQDYGGRARNIPTGPFDNHKTWGSVVGQLWEDSGKGAPVVMGSAAAAIAVQ